MNTDEIVPLLREPCPHENCVLCQEAANLLESQQKEIEQLKSELDKVDKQLNWSNEIIRVLLSKWDGAVYLINKINEWADDTELGIRIQNAIEKWRGRKAEGEKWITI